MTAFLILSVAYCAVRGAFEVGRELWDAVVFLGRAVAGAWDALHDDSVEIGR